MIPTLYPDQFTPAYWDRISHIWKPRELTPKEREARNWEVIGYLIEDLDNWVWRNPFG